MAGLILVSYDIPDDRRRVRLAHALKDFGVRVQYSVFECHLEAAELEKLRQALVRLITPEVDSLRLYRFCHDCGLKMETFGTGKPTEETDIYVL
jgi:CRISPR-associated protein Cas2